MKNKITDKKYIFTFWEPKGSIPDYLKLCMQTWAKFLPEYEVVILDYSNLNDYLDKNYFDNILFKKFSLPMQADAIRCALLKKYGGIWLDTDTIITSPNVENFLKQDSEFCLIGRHIGFIVAKKNAYILQKWDKEIKERLLQFRLFHRYSKYFNKKYYNKLHNWDYLGNGIINKYLDKCGQDKFMKFDRVEIKALPEINYFENIDKNLSAIAKYQQFYFENELSEYALEDNKGVIYLHNSWTPEVYKTMNEKEFLEQKITLSALLRKLLSNINL